ncbi:hypothetical protein GCM10023322_10860 [Rugosimonospora acidiphila]|uniref:CUB domain-containing protein n=1 Tax=Rugosimonospora acidiphila TaxID=556531 RepID=A0ABP9RMM7_9ACTN
MRNIKRGLLSVAAAVAMGAGVLAVSATPAAAASTCGGGLLGNWPITGGYIAVYYSSSTGDNCAMTYTNHPGKPQHIMVEIDDGGAAHRDSGTYSYYAGPVYVHAPGKCVNFEGQIGNGSIDGVINAYCG